MKSERQFRSELAAVFVIASLSVPASAATGTQIGPSGKTYASAEVQCALNPVTGMAPMVQAGLYNPKRNDSATISLNGVDIATVSFLNPDFTVWLANGFDTVIVQTRKKAADSYSFDASLTYFGQPNMCIPDTTGNTIDVANGLETAASGKSSATVVPGCAFNGLTGQPFVNLFDNGPYLLNVSVNNVAVTQLDGITHTSTPDFLSAGLNVISAANAALSTDYFVRDGGTGACTLP